ncbi:MAG: pyridoxamine 5'-phosphate oxidase family protein, partial [Bacteroidota bacterium]
MIKILNAEEGIKMLRNNYIGRLAFVSKGYPYVLPITYFYAEADNCIISYSEEGHKIDAMRKQNAVSIEIDEINSVNNWRSVLVHGDYEEL